jgi:CRP/FNR family cyclic AMP-dependent transcriptional regulator
MAEYNRNSTFRRNRLRPMEDMDFTKPQPAVSPSAPFKAAVSPFYDRAVAARLFQARGRAERFAAGSSLFTEDEKVAAGGLFSKRASSRMYYLAEGEVVLTAGGRTLDTAGAGEVIGEMAVISERPRSATATAKTDCAAWSLDAEELGKALAAEPEFALMLMSVMFDRLRFVTARVAARRIAAAPRMDEPPVFDPALLARLEGALPRSATARYAAGHVIMREGQTVAAVNAGGTFGEMALVDQSPRSATAGALAECELLSIDRPSLQAAVKAQPAVAMAMLRAYAERLRYMNTLLG